MQTSQVLSQSVEIQSGMLTKLEACAYLGMALSTLNRRLTRREIPFVKYGPPTKRGGGKVKIAKKDLDRYLSRCRIA